MKNYMKEKVLLLYSNYDSTLTYQEGWVNAFIKSQYFRVTPFNLLKISFLKKIKLFIMILRNDFDSIIFLHSVFSNQNYLPKIITLALTRIKTTKFYFIGNEYKLMPQKIKFCKKIKLDCLITQSNNKNIIKMYTESIGCKVFFMPNTGIDLNIFYPKKIEKSIDIGYRGFQSPLYLGNIEKEEISSFFIKLGMENNLITDISLNPDDRFDDNNYADFLNKCKIQIGTESGGDYFDLTDKIRLNVNAYLKRNPNASWQTVKSTFFDHLDRSIPIRIISGRQLEAAACKTLQILFEGSYGGFIKPDIHYISLKKDFSNLEEVMKKISDKKFCEQIVNNAYDLVKNKFNYNSLLTHFYKKIYLKIK